MKKKTVFAIGGAVIAVAIFIISSTLQIITGAYLVTADGKYLIVDKKGSPTVMENQSGNEGLFDGLNNGDRIIIICPGGARTTQYPGKLGVILCMRIAKGDLGDVPEATLFELQKMGYRFEGKP